MTRSGPVAPPLAPMLAGGSGPPSHPEAYLVEPKWDGVRAIVRIEEGLVRLISRRGNDVSPAYPELAGLADAFGGRTAVLDGEVVALGEAGRPSFQRLQRRMHVRGPSGRLVADVPVTLVVFDLLWLEGELLTGLPQSERRLRLEDLGVDGPTWGTSPLIPALADDRLLEACREAGLEGFMAKRRDAPYLPGRRSSAWSKVKCGRRRELVVGGWSPGNGARRDSIGSLAVGAWDRLPGAGGPRRLVYAGQVGSGLSQAQIAQLEQVFERYATDHNPFSGPVPKLVRFVEPLLVAEVAYSEVTEAGTLRQPSLLGFRTDLDPAQVVVDEELARGRQAPDVG